MAGRNSSSLLSPVVLIVYCNALFSVRSRNSIPRVSGVRTGSRCSFKYAAWRRMAAMRASSSATMSFSVSTSSKERRPYFFSSNRPLRTASSRWMLFSSMTYETALSLFFILRNTLFF